MILQFMLWTCLGGMLMQIDGCGISKRREGRWGSTTNQQGSHMWQTDFIHLFLCSRVLVFFFFKSSAFLMHKRCPIYTNQVHSMGYLITYLTSPRLCNSNKYLRSYLVIWNSFIANFRCFSFSQC